MSEEYNVVLIGECGVGKVHLYIFDLYHTQIVGAHATIFERLLP